MKHVFGSPLTTLAVVSLLAACGGAAEDREEAAGAAPAAARVAEGKGMEGMEGMHGTEGMQGGGTMVQMQAHMQKMHGADGARMKAMLPEHRQMAANMIAEFNREMRGMNMASDAAWNATVDSLRQDLVRLPEMSADEVAAFMPAHEARLNRLMEMHHGMMGDMKM